MPRVTGNLFDLLELLQSRAVVGGAEIAGRLGVDRRTVRRYVTALQDLGIPVEGARGAGGGYRLRPGFRLPPLMLTEEEAAAVAVGLRAAARLGAGDPASVEAAAAKLQRVLPPALGGRVAALDDALRFTGPAGDPVLVRGERLLELAAAVHRRRRLTLDYRTQDGRETERDVSPHGLVSHAGRWYLVAFDHGRDEHRSFRVDRMQRASLQPIPAAPAPDGFDAAAHVMRSMARLPWRWRVEVHLRLPFETARRRIAPTLAELAEEGEGTRLIARVDSLDFMASVLAGLGCEFEIREPDELRASVRALAARLVAAVHFPAGESHA